MDSQNMKMGKRNTRAAKTCFSKSRKENSHKHRKSERRD